MVDERVEDSVASFALPVAETLFRSRLLLLGTEFSVAALASRSTILSTALHDSKSFNRKHSGSS